jgi:hypothetical protein
MFGLTRRRTEVSADALSEIGRDLLQHRDELVELGNALVAGPRR